MTGQEAAELVGYGDIRLSMPTTQWLTEVVDDAVQRLGVEGFMESQERKEILDILDGNFPMEPMRANETRQESKTSPEYIDIGCIDAIPENADWTKQTDDLG